MSRSGLRQLMTTQQMKIQASCLAEYEQVGTPGYKAASNTAQKKIAAEYHDFLMFSAAIFNILTKKRPLFILTERHGSGYYTTNGRLPPRRTTVAAHKGIKHMP